MHRKGIKQQQRRARSSAPQLQQVLTDSSHLWDSGQEESKIKRDVSEGHTEVVELRNKVHTFVLPVTQHLRFFSSAYTYTGMRWDTADFKVSHLTHSSLNMWWKLRCLLFLELFQPACTTGRNSFRTFRNSSSTEPGLQTAFDPVPHFRDHLFTSSGASCSNSYNSALVDVI